MLTVASVESIALYSLLALPSLLLGLKSVYKKIQTHYIESQVSSHLEKYLLLRETYFQVSEEMLQTENPLSEEKLRPEHYWWGIISQCARELWDLYCSFYNDEIHTADEKTTLTIIEKQYQKAKIHSVESVFLDTLRNLIRDYQTLLDRLQRVPLNLELVSKSHEVVNSTFSTPSQTIPSGIGELLVNEEKAYVDWCRKLQIDRDTSSQMLNFIVAAGAFRLKKEGVLPYSRESSLFYLFQHVLYVTHTVESASSTVK